MSDSARVIQRRRRAWPPAPRTLAAVIATAGLCLLVAACGGSSGSHLAQLSSTITASQAPISRALAFSRCMRAHSVSKYPDPNTSNSGPGTQGLPKVNLLALGVSSSRVDAAERACQRVHPSGAQVSHAASRQILSRLVDFARCMRFHGVSNWPDPSPTLASFPGAPPFGFDLQGIPSLEAGASGSFGPQINTAIGQCLDLQDLASVQVPWGSWQR